MKRLLLVLLATAAADGLRAQGAMPLSTGYESLLREYRWMQRRPPAADSSDSPDARIQRLEIDGLVVDQSMTKIGRDFYDVFFRFWSPPQNAINFTITILEQPLPNTGTLVSVQVNDDLVFQSRLTPQLEGIEQAARQAVFLAARHLAAQDASAPAY